MKSQNAKEIIAKWYSTLDFPSNMDADFYAALENFTIDDGITLESYDTKSQDGIANLMHFLYFCEALEEKYNEKDIPQNILVDTLNDIPTWTKTWSGLKGKLYLGELEWLKRHLGMKLFRLGRLQFCIAKSEHAIPEASLEKGEPIIEVHIPEGEPLSKEACWESIESARAFFARYFPEYKYSLFTCHSWLLDTSLGEFLPDESNIIKFASLFNIVRQDPADAIFGYVFKWGTSRKEANEWKTTSTFSQKIKSAALADREFYEGLGYIK